MTLASYKAGLACLIDFYPNTTTRIHLLMPKMDRSLQSGWPIQFTPI